MGCNILPLLALIYSLSSSYITVRGKSAEFEMSDVRKFLEDKDNIYLVGFTGGLPKTPPNYAKKCLRAQHQNKVSGEYRRLFKHIRYEEAENQEESDSHEMEDPNDAMGDKEVYISFSVDDSRKQVHIVNMYSLLSGNYDNVPEQDRFDVIFGLPKCLVIGKRSNRHERHVCTLWALKSALVGDLPHDCIFELRGNCYNPYIFPPEIRRKFTQHAR